ncbi:MAG: hypothetical protein CMO63_04580 [Verrucomicrobiales bacterium]|nr:hypothetical protein [Verrucomicrobiales bacterium]|tara:strand:- start:1188 stop:1412 length:225 start_codon:yes stop_codon:yes gene_type:complete
MGTARREFEVRLGTDLLFPDVRLDVVGEFERVGRANDAPELLLELERELLDERDEDLEDVRELDLDGALATDVL